MTLSLEEVEHVAQLARLALTDAEKQQFRAQLSAVLDYAGRLQALDTSGIPPTATVLPLRTVLREDQARPPTPREDILANAPAVDGDCFVVPAVFESE